MNFLLCQSCGQHYWITETQCPHCKTSSNKRWVRGSTNAALTLMLGLGVVGCRSDSNDKDTSDSAYVEPSGEPDYGVPDTSAPLYGVPDTGDTGDTAIEPAGEPEYGVPDVDNDGDGFFEFDDCDDADANTFPGAAELDSETDCMKDTDGDGYGDDAPTNTAVRPGTDCDDADPNVFPGQGCE